MEPITTILLADDHALIRHGIKKIIEENPQLEVIGEVGDGLALLEFLKNIPPDLIILDISMPHLRGIEAIKIIKRIAPLVKILMLTMHKSDQFVCSAMSAGAHGYLLKEDSDDELLPAIETIMANDIYLSPSLSPEFTGDIERSCCEYRKQHSEALTNREKQILCLVAEGKTSKEIAEVLDISKRTVEHHRANLSRKLNIKTTASLTKFAIREGYVTPPPE